MRPLLFFDPPQLLRVHPRQFRQSVAGLHLGECFRLLRGLFGYHRRRGGEVARRRGPVESGRRRCGVDTQSSPLLLGAQVSTTRSTAATMISVHQGIRYTEGGTGGAVVVLKIPSALANATMRAITAVICGMIFPASAYTSVMTPNTKSSFA